MRSPLPPAPRSEGHRRSRSATVGAVTTHGDARAADLLRLALTVPPLPDRVDDEDRPLVESALHVHLFHSFAARMHPLTARHLLRTVQPGQRVLDPFAGSGTALIEAALRGAVGAGVDVGELQLRLTRWKATPIPEAMRAALLAKVDHVAETSQDRVRQRQRPEQSWPAPGFDDPRFYEPHVYLELCGLRLAITAAAREDPPLGEALLLIFSSLVLKASRQRSESDATLRPRPLGKLQVTRWFVHRASEVMRLHASYAARLASGPAPGAAPRMDLLRGDARRDLPRLVTPGSVDVVLTSPPYLGVYDYAAHHQRRCAWLNIALEPTLREEIGARQQAQEQPLNMVLADHLRDTRDWLQAVAVALRPQGQAFVLIGDSLVQGEFVPGEEAVLRTAASAGLRCVAGCAVERPSAPGGPRRSIKAAGDGPGPEFRGSPLREHLLLLTRT